MGYWLGFAFSLVQVMSEYAVMHKKRGNLQIVQSWLITKGGIRQLSSQMLKSGPGKCLRSSLATVDAVSAAALRKKIPDYGRPSCDPVSFLP